MTDGPPDRRKMILALGVLVTLVGGPAGAYWFERSDEVRRTVPGTAVVTGCDTSGCVGRFASDDGVVTVEPVPLSGNATAAVRMWLSPRERYPEPEPARLWPVTVVALAVVLGVALLFIVLLVVERRSQRRTGRSWRPAGWRSTVLNQVVLVIVLGGLLAWCSGLGAVGTAVGWVPGHVVGMECPVSGCVGQFVPDDGSPPRTVDLPDPPSRDPALRAWAYEDVTFDPPPDPALFLLLPLIAVVLFDAWWLVDHLRTRRGRVLVRRRRG